MIYDIAVIGAGIAGASLAAELDPRLSCVVLEAEDQPGYHATGRSAAFWDECYGGPEIQPLTSASGAFLRSPDPGFHDSSFLRPRGALYIGKAQDKADLRRFMDEFAAQGVQLQWQEREDLVRKVAGVKDEWRTGVYGPNCSDIDVAALHQAYLRRAKSYGHDVMTRFRVDRISQNAGIWRIAASNKAVEARLLVNASGAWADAIAQLAGVTPLGHQPYRRTVIQLRTNPAVASDLPLVIDHQGQFYFKPDVGGRLWLSPHDETACEAGDVAPDEVDIALAINRMEQVLHLSIEVVERRWAGLRTFAPDRLPVYGPDPAMPSFFWCSGQGGFGIQTAPAAALLCAALIEGRLPHPSLAGIDPTRFAPGRFLEKTISAQ